MVHSSSDERSRRCSLSARLLLPLCCSLSLSPTHSIAAAAAQQHSAQAQIVSSPSHPRALPLARRRDACPVRACFPPPPPLSIESPPLARRPPPPRTTVPSLSLPVRRCTLAAMSTPDAAMTQPTLQAQGDAHAPASFSATAAAAPVAAPAAASHPSAATGSDLPRPSQPSHAVLRSRVAIHPAAASAAAPSTKSRSAPAAASSASASASAPAVAWADQDPAEQLLGFDDLESALQCMVSSWWSTAYETEIADMTHPQLRALNTKYGFSSKTGKPALIKALCARVAACAADNDDLAQEALARNKTSTVVLDEESAADESNDDAAPVSRRAKPVASPAPSPSRKQRAPSKQAAPLVSDRRSEQDALAASRAARRV